MVKRVFNFVYKEVRGLHQAAYVLAFFAFGSQLLAIVRDRLLAYTFGASSELDLYYAAFRVPDLLFVLFASVLSIYVLLPFVNRQRENVTLATKDDVLTQVFTLFCVLYTGVALGLYLLAPWYVPLLYPGLAAEADTLVTLQRILLLQPFLLGVSSVCGVVTQMNHRFVLYAISPLLYNIGIILGIVLWYPVWGLVGLVSGVVLGALGHLLVQLPFVRESDFRFRFGGSIDWTLMKEIIAVSLPRALTLSTNQLVLLGLVSMATLMTAGSVSVFQFAFNLQSVPLAIIGMSYSVAAFPMLSHLYARQDTTGFNRQLVTALRHIIFWSLPTMGLIIVLRAQIVRVLLGSGEFGWGDTRLTAALLAVFVLGLAAQAVLLLFVRAFYASGRTVAPFLVALVGAAVSLVSAVWLRVVYHEQIAFQLYLNDLLRLRDVLGAEVLLLAVAFVLGQLLQVVALLILAHHTFALRYRSLWRVVVDATGATIVGCATAYVTLLFIVDGINQNTFIGIALQGLAAALMGLVMVFFMYRMLYSKELAEIIRSLERKFFATDIVDK